MRGLHGIPVSHCLTLLCYECIFAPSKAVDGLSQNMIGEFL